MRHKLPTRPDRIGDPPRANQCERGAWRDATTNARAAARPPPSPLCPSAQVSHALSHLRTPLAAATLRAKRGRIFTALCAESRRRDASRLANSPCEAKMMRRPLARRAAPSKHFERRACGPPKRAHHALLRSLVLARRNRDWQLLWVRAKRERNFLFILRSAPP